MKSLYFLCIFFLFSLTLNVGLDHMFLFWQKALFFIINKLFCSIINNYKKGFLFKRVFKLCVQFRLSREIVGCL